MMTEDNQGKKYDLIATEFANMRDSFYLEQKYLDLWLFSKICGWMVAPQACQADDRALSASSPVF